MTGHRPFSTLRSTLPVESQARVDASVRADLDRLALKELRKARATSQADLAEALKVGQPAIAKLEQRTDMYVSNLRRYVEALGGKLEITAHFPEGDVIITNFEALGDPR